MTQSAIADAARAAALTLAPELDPDLPVLVEATLHAFDDGQDRPGQYDPLAIAGLATGAASLIVTIAQLAWSIYTDQRDRSTEPESETIARQVRISLRDRDIAVTQETSRITDVVITEITRRGR